MRGGAVIIDLCLPEGRCTVELFTDFGDDLAPMYSVGEAGSPNPRTGRGAPLAVEEPHLDCITGRRQHSANDNLPWIVLEFAG